MIGIACENVGVSFGDDTIIENVTFSLNENEKLGIVGVNGAGKSTLFRVISGEYSRHEGNVYIAKDKNIGMLEQENFFDPSSTVYDEALKAKSALTELENEVERLRVLSEEDHSFVDPYSEAYERFVRSGGLEYKSRIKGALRNMGFPEEEWGRKISELSGGQKTRLALTRLILREPDILMLDEPTNHLDVDSVSWLESYLASYKKTVMVISHDRYFLDRVCTSILEIENGHSKLYKGNYSVYSEKKKTDREISERHYKNQQREIARIEAFIEQQRRWNRERNIIAAESRQKMLDKMVLEKKPEKAPDKIRIRFDSGEESGNDVIKAVGVSKSYGKLNLFSDFSVEIRKGDRVFIYGKNGCGKSTLIKLLAERLSPDRGYVEYGYNVTRGYYDQENQDLSPDKTVLDEIWDAYPDLSQTTLRNALALFCFKGDDIVKKVFELSGGEKARLTLCKLILSKNNLLILDEPTNHLDIPSREALESALEGYTGTVIAVSHDRYFVQKLATRIIGFTRDGLEVYNGGYSDFTAFEEKKNKPSDDGMLSFRENTRSKDDYLENKRRKAELQSAKRKLEKAKQEAGALEARIEELDRLLVEYETDYEKASELWKEKEDSEARLLELYGIIEESEGSVSREEIK